MTYKTWRQIERSFAKMDEVMQDIKLLEDTEQRNKAIDAARGWYIEFVRQLQQEIDDAWN